MATPSSNLADHSQAVVFISYKREAYPDAQLAKRLYDALVGVIGENVFFDRESIEPGDYWSEEIAAHIRASDIFVVILSPMALTSAEVKKEVDAAAAEAARTQGARPRILPLTINIRGSLPQQWAEVDAHNRLEWESAGDNERIVAEVTRLARELQIQRRLEQEAAVRQAALAQTEEPYVERPCDATFFHELLRPGATVTLIGAMKTGKTLLLQHGKQKAIDAGLQVADLDLQLLEEDAKTKDRASFYQIFADTLRLKILDLDDPDLKPAPPAIVGSYGSPPDLCTSWFRQNVLGALDRNATSLLLTLDNLDAILMTPRGADFVSMLRMWHGQRFRAEWTRLGLVLVAYNHIFTYLQTDTSFNVGKEIVLEDFCNDHISRLNKDYNLPVPEEDLPLMADLLGGHPYLTQVAFRRLLEENAHCMSDLVRRANTETGPFGTHLAELRRLVFLGQLEAEMKKVLNEGRCAEDAFYKLQRYGLVRRENRTVKPRCRLYAEYFGQILPEER